MHHLGTGAAHARKQVLAIADETTVTELGTGEILSSPLDLSYRREHYPPQESFEIILGTQLPDERGHQIRIRPGHAVFPRERPGERPEGRVISPSDHRRSPELIRAVIPNMLSPPGPGGHTPSERL